MDPRFQSSQANLWLVAFAASLVANAGFLGGLIYGTQDAKLKLQKSLAEKIVPKEEPALVLLAPVMEALSPQPAERQEPPQPSAPVRSPHLSTEDSQAADEPASKPSFVGERNTSAASNDRPSEGAPDRPSLKGREESIGQDTADSRYREGTEDHTGRGDTESSPATAAATPAMPAAPIAPSGQAPQQAAPGALPVNRQQFQQPDELPQPAAPTVPPAQPAEEASKPAADDGLSRETEAAKVEGSLTRIGAGSMDVGDTPRGRYTSNVIRSVERQWQANVGRNREFNMAGTARVRVVVEPTGKVRKVDFLEEYGIGKVQKGFILSSVRDSRLPPMPGDLHAQLKGQPLEIIINFVFGNL